MAHFKLISSTKASDVIPVNKYQSEKTGLTVIIANLEGPLVNGFFCLATEAHDDDGLPHALEHLIFLGSQRYPYKNILDLLANRCMAHGTNAWTFTDHTLYTIYTLGYSGMLTLLPIYLDLILNPTLTDESFLTEVHHVDGNGEDAGVVYCEIQDQENNADSRCQRRLQREAYPNSSYSFEAEGFTKNLRESTNNINVRNYHKKFYRAENLTIILIGQIEAADVFKALETVEDEIITKRERETFEPWVKPWQTIPPLPNYGEYKEQWPADTEDYGQVLFGWRGPQLTASTGMSELTSWALAVVLSYLTETAAAPLQRCLVEREDALASDVSCNIADNISPLIRITLEDVPVDKLELARDEATRCIKCVRDGAEPLDMERMTQLVKIQLREHAADELDPHYDIAVSCIGDALYSQNEQDFIFRLNPQQLLQELLTKGPEYWHGIMQKYFTDAFVTIVGSPSIELRDKMAEEEKNRIEEQIKRLGPSGLATKAKLLDNAVQFNKRRPPPETLAAVPVASCDNLRCHARASWCPAAPCPHFDLQSLPLYARVLSLRVHFVYINLILDTTSVDELTRVWLPLHLDALGECPVRRGDTLVSHEEVISATEQLTVGFNKCMGLRVCGNFSVGQFGNFVHVETRCKPADYEAVVNLLYEILYAPEITKERLLVSAQRLINDFAQVLENGSKMAHDLLLDSVYRKDSNIHWCSVLRQQKFLKSLIEQLNAGGESAEAAIKDAKATFKKITQHAWLHLATDFERYTLSTEPWKRFPKAGEGTPATPSLYWDADLLSGWGGGFVVGVEGLESSFVAAAAPGPRGYAVADVAPLMVALNYFTQYEGPIWRVIRECGLSYGYGARAAHCEGLLEFSLYGPTDAVQAYGKAKTIVEEHLADGKFDEELFASAKCRALFGVLEMEQSSVGVVLVSLANFLARVGDNYASELVCAIAAVTAESAHAAAARWLPTLFDVAQGKMAVVCHPSKVADLQAAFDKINVKLDAFESLEASHLNK